MYIKSVFPISTLGLQCLVREFQFFRLNILAFLPTSPRWGRYSVLYRLFSCLVLFHLLEKQPLAHSGISQVSPVHLHLPRKQASKISGSGVLVLSAVHIAKLAHSSLGQKFCIPPSQTKVSRTVCSSSATYFCSVSRSLFLILFYKLLLCLCLAQVDLQIATICVMKIIVINLLRLSCFLSNTNLCLFRLTLLSWSANSKITFWKCLCYLEHFNFLLIRSFPHYQRHFFGFRFFSPAFFPKTFPFQLFPRKRSIVLAGSLSFFLLGLIF